MRDDEIDHQDPEPPEEDPVTAMLDRLDSTEDFGAPEEAPTPSPTLNRRDLNEMVDQILDDELKRISERRG